MVGANQSVHLFLGGKGLGIQQGTSIWVASPKFSGEHWEGLGRTNMYIGLLKTKV